MRHFVRVAICLFVVCQLGVAVRADGWRLASLFNKDEEEATVEEMPLDSGLPQGSYVDLDSYLHGEPAVGAFAADAWESQFLPSGLVYKSYFAGDKEPRLGLNWLSTTHDNWLWDLSAGSRVGIWRYGSTNPFYPQGLQLDVEGAAFVRLDLDEHRDLRSVDFRGGLPLSFGYGRSQTKFGYYHISSHVGDEFLITHPGFKRLNYVRDSLLLGHSIYVTERLRLYAETAWAFYSDVAKPWEFQFGVDYGPMGPTGRRGAPYWAVNGHLYQELNYSGAFTAQIGWAWRSDDNGRLLRLGFHYFNGLSEQYSFYNLHEQQFGIGIWHDF